MNYDSITRPNFLLMGFSGVDYGKKNTIWSLNHLHLKKIIMWCGSAWVLRAVTWWLTVESDCSTEGRLFVEYHQMILQQSWLCRRIHTISWWLVAAYPKKMFSFALVSPFVYIYICIYVYIYMYIYMYIYIYIYMYTSTRNVWKHCGSLSTSVGLLYVDRWRQQFCRCSSAAEGQHVGFRLCKCKGSYLEVRCQVCCFMRIVLLVGELDLFHLLRWVNLNIKLGVWVYGAGSTEGSICTHLLRN